MAEPFVPLGYDLPEFDVYELCAAPEDFTDDELQVLSEIIHCGFAEIKAKLSKLIGKAKTKADNLSSRIDDTESDIESLQNKVDVAQAALQTINATLDAYDSRIDVLETKANQAQTLFQSINAELADHETRITALEGS